MPVLSPGLDPDFAAAVAEFDDYEADWVSGEPSELRRAYAAARLRLLEDVAPHCSVSPFEADGAAGLLFRPSGMAATEHAIVYFHGGSWMVGAPETHQVPCSHLAALSGLPVFSVRYRLAPEHLFPAQREDGVVAVTELLEQGAGGLPAAKRMFLAGDSAGAAVAFWTEAALNDSLCGHLAGVLGFYGAYGLLPETDIAEPGSGLSRDEILAAYSRLGPVDRLFAEPGFAIVEAARGDGPPCYLAVGDADPLRTDSEALAARLKERERSTTLDIAPGLAHSYLHFVGKVPAARAALERAVGWLRRVIR